MRTKDNKGIYSMRHAILRAAVCAFFAGAAMTASAANPFSDVESDSWAYEAVASLSDQNIVEGYPDGTFKGDKHITRYEMAQITARLLAKRDSLSADQQSVVDKLSREYANDLSSLGVRISELENMLQNYKLIDTKKNGSKLVRIGSTVKIIPGLSSGPVPGFPA